MIDRPTYSWAITSTPDNLFLFQIRHRALGGEAGGSQSHSGSHTSEAGEAGEAGKAEKYHPNTNDLPVN